MDDTSVVPANGELTALTNNGSVVASLRELGFEDKVIQALPPLLALLGVAGLPAAFIGLGAAVLGGGVALLRAREASDAVMWSIHGEIAPVEAAAEEARRTANDATARLDELDRSVRDMGERLSQKQLEQINVIMEEYLRTLDQEWLRCLRQALKVVASNSLPSHLARSVVARLRDLSPEHLQALQRLAVETGGRTDAYVAIAVLNAATGSVMEVFDAETEALLSSSGFIEHQRMGGGLNNWVVNRTYRITELGASALHMLGT